MKLFQKCKFCDREVGGIPYHKIVSQRREVKVLLQYLAGPDEQWKSGAVIKRRKYVKNWHSKWSSQVALFRSKLHAREAIREWWWLIHGLHTVKRKAQ